MNQAALTGVNPDLSFIRWVYQEKGNRSFLVIAGIATVVQFVIFKFLYPFADFFGDSYSYIYAAYANLDINIWPIGYSKFLRAFHGITHSDTALVAFQYFFLELSALYFFFTINYFFRPARNTSLILFIFLFFNPLFLYLSNYVNSDPVFAALSLLWFTELIWIIHRPRLYQVFTQALLLFLAFTVRHNAMYYPFISAITFALSRQSLWRKLAGAALGVALIVPFVIHERNAAYKMYGVKQFSPMSGWLLANNALYMRGHITVDSASLPTAETRELDTLAKDFYRRVKPDFDEYLSAYVANFFIRQPEAPLKRYFRHHYRPEDETASVIAWGKASVVFGDYGSYLIKHYPVEFARYYMLRNVKNYFLPPLEKLAVYNLGEDEVDPIAKYWFDYKSTRVTAISSKIQALLLFFFPAFFLIANLYFIGGVAWFMIKKKYKIVDIYFNRSLLLLGSFLASNFCFCIFTTIIVLRYHFFPMIICLSFSCLLIARLASQENQNSVIVANADNKKMIDKVSESVLLQKTI